MKYGNTCFPTGIALKGKRGHTRAASQRMRIWCERKVKRNEKKKATDKMGHVVLMNYLILHELTRHQDRLDYLRAKRLMCEEIIRSPCSNQNEKNDYRAWIRILEMLKLREYGKFRKKVGI
jgi:hypothetical protein